MWRITFITALFLLSNASGGAQTALDKANIYEAIIQSFPGKNISILNEMVTRIYSYDIDGDYNKWYYRERTQPSSDTSLFPVSMLCVIPVRYSQTVMSYLQSKNVPADASVFLSQVQNAEIDSLEKYLPDNRFVSWKKAPLANSAFRNLFKKKRVTGLSSILFDQQNKIALVKIQVYSKKKRQGENLSKIILLRKVGTDWIITGSLDEKLQSI